MELRDIEYFAVVAQHGNLGRAAEALGLSQPAVSKSLRRLEDELGAKLVKRTPRGVEVTPEGSVLLLRVRTLRLSLQEIAHEVADVNEGRSGYLRIGAGENIAGLLLPNLLSRLQAGAPGLAVKVTVSDNDLMMPALRHGELDLVVNYLRWPALSEGLDHEALCEDETVVCVAVGHRLAGRKRLQLTDLVDERWSLSDRGLPPYGFLASKFAERGLPLPAVVLEARSARLRYESLGPLGLLDFTSHIAYVHEQKRYRLATLPLPELTWRRQIGIIQRTGGYQAPATRRFIELARKIAPGFGAPVRADKPRG